MLSMLSIAPMFLAGFCSALNLVLPEDASGWAAACRGAYTRRCTCGAQNRIDDSHIELLAANALKFRPELRQQIFVVANSYAQCLTTLEPNCVQNF